MQAEEVVLAEDISPDNVLPRVPSVLPRAPPVPSRPVHFHPSHAPALPVGRSSRLAARHAHPSPPVARPISPRLSEAREEWGFAASLFARPSLPAARPGLPHVMRALPCPSRVPTEAREEVAKEAHGRGGDCGDTGRHRWNQ